MRASAAALVVTVEVLELQQSKKFDPLSTDDLLTRSQLAIGLRRSRFRGAIERGGTGQDFQTCRFERFGRLGLVPGRLPFRARAVLFIDPI
jgi:hypothetical protein